VHTHPTLVNALLCSKDSEKKTKELFGDDVLFIPYTDPGYVLFKKVESELIAYRKKKGNDPAIIMLQNHGVFVSADTTSEIRDIYGHIISVIKKNIRTEIDLTPLPVHTDIIKILPAIRMIASEDSIKLCSVRNNKLIAEYTKNAGSFKNAAGPFTPDIIVYCKAHALYIESTVPEVILSEFDEKYRNYKKDFGYPPKIVLIKDMGMIAIEDNIKSVEIALDVFEDLMKISYYSENFGGPKFMNDREIGFIDHWEVENYRRQVSKGSGQISKVANKIIVITGGAQGFGGGIAEMLFDDQANIVIADLNDEKGIAMKNYLQSKAKKNAALFVKTDVSVADSIKNLIYETVIHFGGIDTFISNAGILKAGSLEEMELTTFELMTKINYTAYFLCAKYASAVLKLQASYKKHYFTDIIQINSKSGLKGSNKNFTYAGGKFGGIGLTQSFALELIPYHIKVNSVCPGNFFDGPLWTDPEKGLFVQYLKAGKVQGAKTIEDIKKYYEGQVPAKRGCTVPDVYKAIVYVIDQEYETGQAVPVTGGQEMLN
jgi:NAD(P)-dependent dehydrogenase (short-subunit alcohol dehydrogenase family)/ribulose-5-phosphate 4-epimerase/fuculose-1-phosphate aldolase